MKTRPTAPYTIVKLHDARNAASILADQIPTMAEATALMKTLHDMRSACDMVITDATGSAVKIRRNTGWATAKTRNVEDEPRLQGRVDEALKEAASDQ